MNERENFRDCLIISITPSTSHVPIKNILEAAIAAKSGLSEPDGTIIELAITPAGDLLFKDSRVGDEFTIASGTRKVFYTRGITDRVTLKNAVACQLECYYG